jgi:hypothetical protein
MPRTGETQDAPQNQTIKALESSVLDGRLATGCPDAEESEYALPWHWQHYDIIAESHKAQLVLCLFCFLLGSNRWLEAG